MAQIQLTPTMSMAISGGTAVLGPIIKWWLNGHPMPVPDGVADSITIVSIVAVIVTIHLVALVVRKKFGVDITADVIQSDQSSPQPAAKP